MTDVSAKWQKLKFSELCQRIVSGGTPATDNPRYWNGQTPWVTGADFTPRGIGEIRRFISDAGIRASATSVVAGGNLLVVTRTGVGKLAIAPFDIAISQDIAGVYVDREKACTSFVYHLLSRELGELKKLNQGTSINGIIRADLERHSVRIPTEKIAQRRIAAILTKIDATVEGSEALIDKYQQIKAGLMHDLFTRGVLPNGKIRPSSQEAPTLYKQSTLGWIPNEWAVERCTDLCARICVGIVIQPTQYYVERGVPAFRSANVREDGIDATNFVYISPSANTVLVKSQVRTGDILSVRTGYPGTSAVVPPEFEGANCIDILISTPCAKVSSEYLCYWINSSFGKEQVLRQQGGMAQQHFNVGEMRELQVALPTKLEQQLISERLNAAARKLGVENLRLGKLMRMKLGLMQDLLTGKVPVKVDEPVAETADA